MNKRADLNVVYKSTFVVIIFVVLAILFTLMKDMIPKTTEYQLPAEKYLAVEGDRLQTTTTNEPPKTETVDVTLYTMSKCGFSAPVINILNEIHGEITPHLKLSLDYIGGGNSADGFSSLHGQNEVDGNIIQLCAAKHQPDKSLKLINCMSRRLGEIPGNWMDCAAELGMETEDIRRCAEGGEGKTLLTESFKRTATAGVYRSPSIYIDGVYYDGKKTKPDIMKTICDKLKNKPIKCSEVNAT